MAMALDTLAYARRLREAGFSEQQADSQAEALAAAMTDSLATKQDLSALRHDVETGFAALRHEMRELESRMEAGFATLRHEMRELELRMTAQSADLERRMTMRLGGMMMAGIAVVSALDRLG